ncbi:MAG TPA: RdgB/HAM1 family non-canonical purine NTP pyrophosphatase [Enteractinococcus helveticum]|uniref:dITP/XTP pyrophosphatase n=1 Tax=Enteractinococcus helveticum TaxID=1837282 RepID=A0A921FLR4_9MICC|nr:RdgB/HAM1 family non-canonical purine NTP pyrophosphatase [Enteractinococcus helveticum]HJF14520.1 RdgB/HAM1 family non-canonical purine NTP pyrophosphatase [Enteractinococcus helveticum]
MEPLIVLASNNAGKLRELRAILTEAIPTLDPAQIIDAATVNAPDIVEDGVTFEANALKKATLTAQATGLIAVADDSGLTVDVMHGAPGIFSARWAGTHGDDQANLDLLLAQLSDIDHPHRGAAFVCAAALATPDGETRHVEFGQLAGDLTFEPRGNNGFGYDPIVELAEYGQTCAELDSETKNAISHRGKAFRALAPHLAGVLGK